MVKRPRNDDVSLQMALLDACARERRRIGQELHDSVGQELTGIALLLDALEKKVRTRAEVEASDVRRLANLVGQTAERIRSIASGLMPVAVDDEGLQFAFEKMAELFADAQQISVVVQGDAAGRVTDEGAANHLFRIGQEAVTNAVKHGRPSRVDVSLVEDDGHLVLTVADDGIGFDYDRAKHDGLGLGIMKHRASLIGGSFRIERAPGGGMRVECRYPLP